MAKETGQDYTELMKELHTLPEVEEHLNSFSVIVGDLVLARRIHLGWSQTKLANAAKTTQARVSQIEAGYDGVKMETLSRVFKALGLVQMNPKFSEDAVCKEEVTQPV
ncbi:helix-turn-helix domain-containing protein [Paenibacillus terrae]|uniref:helix-turn-helix domain-containing protein n=1 Tax=Paenibacillus terrae TaxID=159743 RepID=UPI001CA3C9F9|nr:helix-turn-helix domain-containing protein [Paenibacillus terrae]